MNVFQDFNKITKILLAFGATLLIYGYLARVAEIFFFWESKAIGWAILFLGTISFLREKIKFKKKEKKNSIIEKIGIGFLIFGLFAKAGIFFTIPNSEAYEVAIKYVTNNKNLIEDIGTVESTSLLPSGGIQENTDSLGSYGAAQVDLIVKGNKKHREVSVIITKTVDKTTWEVKGHK